MDHFQLLQADWCRGECDTLWVAVTISKYSGIETFWRFVASSSLSVTINAQHLSTEFGWALWHHAIVCIASGHIQNPSPELKRILPPLCAPDEPKG